MKAIVLLISGLMAGCATYPVSDVGYEPDDSYDQELAARRRQQQAESDQWAREADDQIQLHQMEAQQLQIRQQQQREEQQRELESYGIKTYSQ